MSDVASPEADDTSMVPRAGRPDARWRTSAAVVLVGLTLTAILSWSAYAVDRHTERRLLDSQTRQAANGVSAAIVGIVAPLRTVAAVGEATNGDAAKVDFAAAPVVGNGKTFAAVDVLRRAGAGYRLLSSVGAPALRAGSAAQVQALAHEAQAQRGSFAVSSATVASGTRVLYAVSSVTGTYVIYAERTIPASRRVAVEATSAFAGLHFATYLGGRETPAALVTTDLPDRKLPLRGTVARSHIPFGNGELLLVASSAQRLGGGIEGSLWWVVALSGVAVTLVAARLIGALARRRNEAVRDMRTIARLYDELNDSYTQQRGIAETLQHALLPQYNPELPGVDVATCYVAGARGVQVGGDWFSLIRIDDDTFGFVVGDVSGRGVAAATIMARLRFTVRAYLLEGHPPDVVLGMCSRDLDVRRDGHLATALVGVAQLSTGAIRLASAGHLDPLLVDAGGTRPIPVTVGRPLGAGAADYVLTSAHVPAASTLLAFTDGLVERRDQAVETGVARVSELAEVPGEDLGAWLRELLDTMLPGGGEDDVAMLALRWV